MQIEILFYILSGVIVLSGLAGVFLPMFPGVSLIFVGILVASITSKFSFISNSTIIILGLLTLISFLVDYLSGFLGAKYSGASILGSVGAILGAVFGVTTLGPIGLILGPALGVLIFEFLLKKPIKQSAKSATYTFFSTIVGMIVNTLIALIMITVFISSIFI